MLRRKYSKLLLGIATAISLTAVPFITTNQNVFAAEGDEEIVAQNEDDFITQLQSGQIFISGLSRNDFTKVVIPSEIDGKPVTKINENAFRDKTKIKEVVIPDSVTNIETNAFYNCNSLSELTIPVDVTAYNAFDYCRAIKKITYTKGKSGEMPDADNSNDGNGQYYEFTPAWRSSSLTEVVFSDGITHIGDMAMRDQTKLTSVTMPNNEVSVGTLAFYRCYAIENIDTSNIIEYSARSFEECDNLASVSFNEKVTEIPDRTFYSCDKLDNLVIPDKIRTIGTDAFYYNIALTNLTIPVDVTAYNAFAYCSAIQKITYTKGLNDGKMPDADDSNDGNGQYYEFTPAWRSSSLTEVVFSDGITHIGDMAMRDQTKLTSVTMPNNEVSVGTLAFYRCYSITNIDTSNIIKYSARSFEECDNLASVSFNEKVTEIPDRTFYSCDKLDNLVIPDKIRTIGIDAFYYNVALTNLTIPVDVTAYNAFGYCGAIKKITYTKGLNDGKMPDADESNDGNGQYYPFTPANRSNNLETIILSDGITHIGDNAFRNHGNTLVNVTFPSNEYSVGYAAFYQDYALSISDEDISKATSIGAYAFQQCSGLETVSINSKVTEIPLNAFYGCAGIKTLIIPDSVKNIGDNAFRECTGITEVTIPVDVKARDSFYYCINIATINYTPGDTGEMIDFVYSGGTYNHAASIAMRTNSLTTVNFSDGVTHIGDNCLRERAGLTQVRFPNNEFSVGGAAFYQDTALVVEDKDVAKVTKLGDYAFHGCGGLTNLEFNSKLEKIPSYAFKNCTGIEILSIPDNVTELGGEAFNGCTNIKEISIPIDINYTDNTFSEYNFVEKVIYTKGQDGDSSHSTGYNVASSLQKKTDNNQTVIFAEGVNYVAGSMFNDNCNKSITNVRFPKTLNGIGANAFVKGIDAVFYGYKGTDAEKYVNTAEDNTLSFRPLEYPLFNEGGCPGSTELGKEEQYSAFVYTDIDETSDAIEWSVSDKMSSKTSIDQTGKLTVGDNEASREIHVYAQYGQSIVDVPVTINRTVSIVQFNAGNGTASEEAMV
nr:leucine-rich repeat domain-containing protein [Eubacterium sp.]